MPTQTATCASPNQIRRLFPSHLETFQQCRRRFHWKVDERRPVEQPLGLALIKGNVAHETLKICGRDWGESASMPANLESLIAPRLPRSEYSSQAAWQRDVAEIADWVKYGLAYLDPYATILGVERFLYRAFRLDDSSVPVTLGAVIDMLLLRDEPNGEKFIEIVDYKTGKSLDGSIFAPVISRYVLKPLVSKFLPGQVFGRVMFTELYVAKRQIRTSELTSERCLADWEEVKRTIAAITTESEWAPTPSPLCQWCQFNGHGCVPELEGDRVGLW